MSDSVNFCPGWTLNLVTAAGCLASRTWAKADYRCCIFVALSLDKWRLLSLRINPILAFKAALLTWLFSHHSKIVLRVLHLVNIFTLRAEAWAPELRHRQHMAHLFKESAWTVIQRVRSAHASKDPPTTSAAPRVAEWTGRLEVYGSTCG